MAETTEPTFDVTIVARAKHGILWALVKEHGSIKALAEVLGVSDSTVSGWVALRRMPKIVGKGGRSRPQIRRAMLMLVQMTGCPLEEIFPGFVKEKLDEIPRSVETTHRVSTAMLEYATRTTERLTLPSPERAAEQHETQQWVGGFLECLTYREREIIKLRYGVDSEFTYSLEEVGHIFKVTRERIRMIEAKALRKLQRAMVNARPQLLDADNEQGLR